MTNYKLYYFNAKGRAEIIRLVFAQAGVKYEDIRVNSEEWGKLKPNSPWGGLPILEVDGTIYGQSMAIARFVARNNDLCGKTSLEQGLVDSVIDGAFDVVSSFLKWGFEKDKTKKAEAKKKFDTEELPNVLGNLERILVSNNGGNGYLVGDSVTWADIYVFNMYDTLVETFLYEDPFKGYPKLDALVKRVKELPNIKKWLQERPKTQF